MKIAIVGAGIVGVTTAYELARDGHAVTVYEQNGAVAEGSSFAQGGLLGALLHPMGLPALTTPPWAGRHAAPRLQRGASASDMLWRWRWRRQGRRGLQPEPLQAAVALARYSQERLGALCRELGADPELTQGQLVLLRHTSAREQLNPVVDALRTAGMAVRDVDVAAARALEPGLGEEAPLAAALHCPDAGAGNGRLAAQLMRQAAQAAGVHWVFNTRVAQIHSQPVGITLASAPQPLAYDAVVVCAGQAATSLLRPLGLRLLMAGVAGYSINAPLRESLHAPQGSVIDLGEQITITRLGQRIRIAGGAELGGHEQPHHEPTLRRLYQTVNEWFPGGALLSSGLQIWRGVRPTLPDGLPALGTSGLPGVWINAAHGASGWSQASGCAKVLADLIAQRPPAITIEPFSAQRMR